MSFGAFFCLLMAHFAADFPLQFKKIVNLKQSENRKEYLLGNSIHAGIHLVVSLISVAYFWSPGMILVTVSISIIHGTIDCIKSWAVLNRPFRKYSTGIFLLDQACHLFSIYFLLYIIYRNAPGWSAMQILKSRLMYFLNSSLSGVTYIQKLALSIVLFIVGVWGVGIFIRILLNSMSLRPYKAAINLKLELVNINNSGGTNDGGYIIGLLERSFIIISIILNIPLVIGFILTAKSVARLKKFDDDKFVEIFIIGSFSSFIPAIVIGYVIKALSILPY